MNLRNIGPWLGKSGWLGWPNFVWVLIAFVVLALVREVV